MSILDATNGFITHGWMVTELGLRGPELTTYAIVHQFSQSKAGVYKGGVPYIMAWLGCSDVSARKYLHSLEKKGLIRSIPGDINGVPFRDYQVTDNHIPKILGDTPKILGVDTQDSFADTPKILGVDNNKIDNNIDFIKSEKIIKIFFFNNWPRPNQEYRKLVAYNSGPAVKKKWQEMTDKERLYVAMLWKQTPQQPPRFDLDFISLWKDVCLKLHGMDAPIDIRLAALDDKLRYDVRDGRVILTIPASLSEYLEQYAESYRPFFKRFLQLKGCKKLTYHISTI